MIVQLWKSYPKLQQSKWHIKLLGSNWNWFQNVVVIINTCDKHLVKSISQIITWLYCGLTCHWEGDGMKRQWPRRRESNIDNTYAVGGTTNNGEVQYQVAHWWRTMRVSQLSLLLTHWGRDKMDAILQTISSNAFSWMKMFQLRLKFHWSLFPRVQLTIFQHWFR